MITNDIVGDLLTRTFSTLSDDVPVVPPLRWAESKAMHHRRSRSPLQRLIAGARRHRGWTFSIALVAGVAGAGAGAAASGVFSSQANSSFRQDYSLPLPAAFGRIPAFDPAKEKLEVVDPGPEGTTISVWTYAESPAILCIAGVESKAGKATFPGKPAEKVPVGGCSGGPDGAPLTGPGGQPAVPTFGADGGIWRAPSGQLFRILAGQAPSGASSVTLVLSNATETHAVVKNRWYAIGLPYSVAFGFTGSFQNADGENVAGVTSH